MSQGEIPLDRWIKFFEEFTHVHRGRFVSLDVFGPSLGAQQEVRGLPLVGITVDVRGRRHCVEIIVGGRANAHLTRVIESPTRVWHKEPGIPGQEAIDFESGDGTKTVLRFLQVQTDHLLKS